MGTQVSWRNSHQRNGPSSQPASSGCRKKARTPETRKDTGNYPMPEKGHAISAKRLARKNRKDGNLTKDEFDRIERKADKVITDS